jgi:hypothetical protein
MDDRLPRYRCNFDEIDPSGCYIDVSPFTGHGDAYRSTWTIGEHVLLWDDSGREEEAIVEQSTRQLIVWRPITRGE